MAAPRLDLTDRQRRILARLVAEFIEQGEPVSSLWLAERSGLPKGERYGWHSLRRKFTNELRDLNLKDLAALGGWK